MGQIHTISWIFLFESLYIRQQMEHGFQQLGTLFSISRISQASLIAPLLLPLPNRCVCWVRPCGFPFLHVRGRNLVFSVPTLLPKLRTLHVPLNIDSPLFPVWLTRGVHSLESVMQGQGQVPHMPSQTRVFLSHPPYEITGKWDPLLVLSSQSGITGDVYLDWWRFVACHSLSTTI